MFEARPVIFPIWEAPPFQRLTTEYTDPESKPLLVWFDNLRQKQASYFEDNRVKGQIVNRLPKSLTLCLKGPFIRMVQQLLFRAANERPPLQVTSQVIPPSYVLAMDRELFEADIESQPRSFILKPDGGAMGLGIRFVTNLSDYHEYLTTPRSRHVVQLYLESAQFNQRKFDLRLYVLVTSSWKAREGKADNPFRVYVYRQGIARVCAEQYSTGSIYARLTNTAVNKKVQPDMEEITKLTDDVLPRERCEEIWQKIEEEIGLVIVASLPVLKRGLAEEDAKGFNLDYFQVFGFDVMFEPDWTPYILEVNYRPSLSRGTRGETDLKSCLLIDTFRTVLRERLQMEPEQIFAESVGVWKAFLASVAPETNQAASSRRFHEVNLTTPTFVRLVRCMAAAEANKIDQLVLFQDYVQTVGQNRFRADVAPSDTGRPIARAAVSETATPPRGEADRSETGARPARESPIQDGPEQVRRAARRAPPDVIHSEQGLAERDTSSNARNGQVGRQDANRVRSPGQARDVDHIQAESHRPLDETADSKRVPKSRRTVGQTGRHSEPQERSLEKPADTDRFGASGMGSPRESPEVNRSSAPRTRSRAKV
jgi:hypothetical protein